MIRRTVLTAFGLIVLAVFGGLFVMISGIAPIKASSGHWAITEAFLQFAKRRSVTTHTLTTKVPPLDDPALVLKGAGHYDFGCRACHGSPSLEQPRIAAQMTPRPPDLRGKALTYEPEELFYIVKHGIKFTGMPAWPARERDDEVWAMVAFLKALPFISVEEYHRLARGPADDSPRVPLEDLVTPSDVPAAITENCARCHGTDGLGRGLGVFPKVASQQREYLAASLEAYARGKRHSGLMEPVAAGLGLDEMREIADYYARQPGSGSGPVNDAALVEEGRSIATRGRPDSLVPRCAECHGPGVARNPNYPRLAGQYARYLELQLTLFKNEHRGGTPYADIMRRVAGQLTDEQIKAVSAYYASLPWEMTR